MTISFHPYRPNHPLGGIPFGERAHTGRRAAFAAAPAYLGDIPYGPPAPGQEDTWKSGDDPGAAGYLTMGVMQGVQTALQTGSKARGAFVGGLWAAAAIPGPQQPFIAAAAALAAPIAAIFDGCPECREATQVADEAEQALYQLHQDYFYKVWSRTSNEGWVLREPRYKSEQLAVLYAMDQIYDHMYQLCSNPALKDAGQRCINERLKRGSRWDWIAAFRDKVAADSGVKDDPPLPEDQTTSTGGLFSGGSSMPLLLGGAALAFAFLAMGDQ
jgi:hypothetical protein